MRNIAVFILMLLVPYMASASMLDTGINSLPALSIPDKLKQQLRGSPVYIQIFKEEAVLELYVKLNGQYRLLNRYPVCKFSGGLGPKRLPGDLKSPEGFYRIDHKKLNPNSRFTKSMNIGFPNAYDRAHGYQGSYLMIHGDCVSEGCYAMTDAGIEDIYRYVNSALGAGQPHVAVSIYPFRMTEANMQRHKYSRDMAFWKQLKPGYDYFIATHTPPEVSINHGRYVVSAIPSGKGSIAQISTSNDFSPVK